MSFILGDRAILARDRTIISQWTRRKCCTRYQNRREAGEVQNPEEIYRFFANKSQREGFGACLTNSSDFSIKISPVISPSEVLDT